MGNPKIDSQCPQISVIEYISNFRLPIADFSEVLLSMSKKLAIGNRKLAIGNWKCTHCHLKIFNATAKLAINHAPRIATFIQFVDNDVPSFITERNKVLSAVNGKALMNG